MILRLVALLTIATLGIAGAPAVTAATFTLKLVEVRTGNPPPGGDTSPRIDMSGDDWTYDDVAQTVSAGSRYEVQYLAGPATVFRHHVDGFILDASPGGGPADGTFFECIEGVFAPSNFGRSFCAAYSFGANFVDESLPTWGPGLAFDQGLNANPIAGGDDVSTGTPINLHGEFDGTSLTSWDGTTLVVGNFITQVDGHRFTFVRPAEAVDDPGYGAEANSTGNVFDIGANDLRWSANPEVVDDASGTATGTGSLGGTFTVVAAADIGSVTVTYDAAATTGTDTWVYRVTDTEGPLAGQFDTATVTVLVSQSGTANDDSAATTRLRAPVSVNVGTNDVGFADPSTVTITAGAAQGDVTVANSPGPKNGITVTYQSTAPLFTAPYQDEFTYQITDGTATDTAVVTVTVNNAIPVANDLAGVVLDTQGVSPSAVSIDVNVGDGGDIAGNALGDATTVVTTATANDVTTSVSGGTITLTAATFTSAGDAVGYTITDADGEADTGTISLTIPDVTPQVADVAETIAVGDSATITVAVQPGNGAPGDHMVSVSQAQFGTVTNVALSAGGTEVSFDYEATGFGTDALTVSLSDGDGSIGAGTASIIVPDRVPTVQNVAADIVVAGATTITVACQLGDGAAGEHVASVSSAEWGSVDEESIELNAAGTEISFDYTPSGFGATDVLTVGLTDADGSTGSGTATLTIKGDAVTIAKQDSLPGTDQGNALGPVGLGALLLAIPLLRSRRRRR